MSQFILLEAEEGGEGRHRTDRFAAENRILERGQSIGSEDTDVDETESLDTDLSGFIVLVCFFIPILHFFPQFTTISSHGEVEEPLIDSDDLRGWTPSGWTPTPSPPRRRRRRAYILSSSEDEEDDEQEAVPDVKEEEKEEGKEGEREEEEQKVKEEPEANEDDEVVEVWATPGFEAHRAIREEDLEGFEKELHELEKASGLVKSFFTSHVHINHCPAQPSPSQLLVRPSLSQGTCVRTA
jgi:hypothetical protein